MAENQKKISRLLQTGRLSSVDFEVSWDMIRKFIELTSDRSSLHTDEIFARKTLYRETIVHGMLPILFIATLPVCLKNSYFSKVSARFLRPVYAGEKLTLASRVLKIEKEGITVEFILRDANTKAVVTAGSFMVTKLKFENRKMRRPSEDNHFSSMVLEPLEEQQAWLSDISTGDTKDFSFMVSDLNLYDFCQIFKTGNNRQATINDRASLNLLGLSLFSTFVGMCLPGKNATLMDVQVVFNRPIELNKKYRLVGKIVFKSESTSTIVEHISISDFKDQNETYAMGKVTIKVNAPEAQMPSIKELKENEFDLQLKNRIVLITGASRGIGETTAKLFSLHGSKVIVNYSRSKEDAERVVDEIVKNGGEAVSIQGDVADRAQVKKMVEEIRRRFGTIHVLVNNAVRDFYPTSFLDLSWDDFARDMDVNLKGAINCCQEVLPLMMKHNGGKIINISTVAVENPPPQQSKYVISKSALVGLTRSLAVEFAPYNIQVNMVTPNFVETDLTKHIAKVFSDKIKADTLMKRNATAAEVAKAVIFLASSQASFTTGQKIMVTGGPPFL